MCEALNPSNHNVSYLQFDFNISLSVYSGEIVSRNCGYSWCKASPQELSNYSRVLNNNLRSINIPNQRRRKWGGGRGGGDDPPI